MLIFFTKMTWKINFIPKKQFYGEYPIFPLDCRKYKNSGFYILLLAKSEQQALVKHDYLFGKKYRQLYFKK